MISQTPRLLSAVANYLAQPRQGIPLNSRLLAQPSEKLFLSRQVSENTGVLPATTVLEQGCSEHGAEAAWMVLFQLQRRWDFTPAEISSSKGNPMEGPGNIVNAQHGIPH